MRLGGGAQARWPGALGPLPARPASSDPAHRASLLLHTQARITPFTDHFPASTMGLNAHCRWAGGRRLRTPPRRQQGAWPQEGLLRPPWGAPAGCGDFTLPLLPGAVGRALGAQAED